MADNRTELAGSDRAPVPGAYIGATIPDTERIEVTIVLRRRAELSTDTVVAGALDPAALGASFGADPGDLDLVTDIVRASGAEVIDSHAASRRIRIAGTSGQLSQLFGTTLYRSGSGGRGRAGALSLPAELTGVVTAVLGLDDRAQAAPKLRIVPAAARSTSYTPVQLAQIYGMPDADGTGQTVAIIELGGGFGQSDLSTYFTGLKLPVPSVTAVSVDGAANLPGQDPSGADGEVLLDIEVVGALVPAADILVYFAPNTDAGFLDAIAQATHATPTPAAMSISWGQSEDDWTAQARAAMDAAFADAAAVGITVTVAAGDDGSSDRATDGGAHVDFPASSPHVLACGGTNLLATSAGVITSETVWNGGSTDGATGGGVSDAFALPSWQSTAGVPAHPKTGKPGRGVPDVAGDADPRTGYDVLIDGSATVIGGTSAVAPLWAGLAARLAQLLDGKLGLLAPRLYSGVTAGHPVAGLRDITVGNNGAYKAGPGWDACTGLGVASGAELLARLKSTTLPS
jgi:kumamolisin